MNQETAEAVDSVSANDKYRITWPWFKPDIHFQKELTNGLSNFMKVCYLLSISDDKKSYITIVVDRSKSKAHVEKLTIIMLISFDYPFLKR